MAGIHTWPYLLAHTLVRSGSGADQSATDFHTLHVVHGVETIAGVVSDNASTQLGIRSSQAVKLGEELRKEVVFVR